MRERTIKKQFWINQKEDDLLKEKSKKAGLNESEFLRSIIKGQKIKEQPTEEIRKFISLLSNIANNINQIARVVNGTRTIRYEDLENLKNETNDLLADIRKKIFSRGND